LYFDNIFGFVINKPSSMTVVGITVPIKRPHWFSVKKIGTTHYNLDSKLREPKIIGEQESDVIQFLTHLMEEETKTEILLVVEKNVSETKSWKRTDSA